MSGGFIIIEFTYYIMFEHLYLGGTSGVFLSKVAGPFGRGLQWLFLLVFFWEYTPASRITCCRPTEISEDLSVSSALLSGRTGMLIVRGLLPGARLDNFTRFYYWSAGPSTFRRNQPQLKASETTFEQPFVCGFFLNSENFIFSLFYFDNLSSFRNLKISKPE